MFQKEASIIFVKSEVRVGGNKIVFIGYFRSRNLYSDLIRLNEMVGVPHRGIFSSSGWEGGTCPFHRGERTQPHRDHSPHPIPIASSLGFPALTETCPLLKGTGWGRMYQEPALSLASICCHPSCLQAGAFLLAYWVDVVVFEVYTDITRGFATKTNSQLGTWISFGMWRVLSLLGHARNWKPNFAEVMQSLAGTALTSLSWSLNPEVLYGARRDFLWVKQVRWSEPFCKASHMALGS